MRTSTSSRLVLELAGILPILFLSSSATIYKNLRQFWGGGSSTDDFTPITMGMFAITKYWWQQGQMDPALDVWGGENVEISFRTWLCGGRIMVARDAYVAHYFRTKPTYKVGRMERKG